MRTGAGSRLVLTWRVGAAPHLYQATLGPSRSGGTRSNETPLRHGRPLPPLPRLPRGRIPVDVQGGAEPRGADPEHHAVEADPRGAAGLPGHRVGSARPDVPRRALVRLQGDAHG